MDHQEEDSRVISPRVEGRPSNTSVQRLDNPMQKLSKEMHPKSERRKKKGQRQDTCDVQGDCNWQVDSSLSEQLESVDTPIAMLACKFFFIYVKTSWRPT